MRTESINALNCIGFTAISESSENCKEHLRRLGREEREEHEDLNLSLDDDEEPLENDSAFGDGYYKLVVKRVNDVCQNKLDEFFSSLSERADYFVEEVGAERRRAANSKMRIWKARATLFYRLSLVAISLFAALFLFSELAPSQFDSLLLVISDRLLESILVGVVSTGLVLASVYIVTGAKNENLRLALRPVFLETWTSWTKRRHLASALKAHFDESYDRLVGDLSEMPLQVDNAIAEGVAEWLKSHSESHRKAAGILAELRQVILARCQLFDQFIGVVNQYLNEIPVELRETANGIKNNVIEEHMSRIRGAATAVEDVKSDVERIASISMHFP